MHNDLPFNIDIPLNFFEKAGGDVKKRRRIGGIASIETEDRQNETLLQRGLDFNEFVPHGWFNDNHTKDTDGVIGCPESAAFFDKGQKLPNGDVAEAPGHWVEGYLLNTKRADRIWELGKALQETDRRLGFSVEGTIKKRLSDRNKVAKAIVREVAVTKCPVNVGAKMEILSKSLWAVENDDFEDLKKTLSMGPGTGTAPVGPQTGEGAGQVITPESLESDIKPKLKREDEDKKKKKLNKSRFALPDAFAWYHARLPNATPEQIGRLIQITQALKQAGRL